MGQPGGAISGGLFRRVPFQREFDEAVVRLATSASLRRYRMEGWAQFKMEGMRMIRDLRKIVRTSPAYDLFTRARGWPYGYNTDSSITDGLAIIGPIATSP